MRNAYNILVRKSGRKTPLGRRRRRSVDNRRMQLRKIWWEAMEWIFLPGDRDQW
jgi:hypothetical protein